MEHGRPYGSGELTPDVIRNVRFGSHGGAYSPAEVHEFLEQVASAMEVLSSTDVGQAMRRELQRNAEISQRVVMAGQETSERLRQQAAEDAKSIVEDTKQLAEQLRDASREELRRTREHIEDMRRAFILELRDMYDRVGATLYRFETASRASEAEAQQGGAPAAPAGDVQYGMPPAAPAAAPQGAGWADDPAIGWTAEPPGPPPAHGALGEEPLSPRAEEGGARPPAWTQLHGEEQQHGAAPTMAGAWEEPPAAPTAWSEPAPQQQEWAQEPEPGQAWAEQPPAEQAWGEPPAHPWGETPDTEPALEGTWTDQEAGAEAEPLVDLRGIQHEIHAEPEAPAAGEAAGGWLEGGAGEQAQPPVDLAPLETGLTIAEPLVAETMSAAMAEEPVAEAQPEAGPPVAEQPAGADQQPGEVQPDAQPDPTEEDRRAEALLAGIQNVMGHGDTPEPPPLPEPPSLTGNGGGMTDEQALTTFVLQSLSEGQSREAIEGYLAQTYGVADPTTFVDGVLASAAGGDQPPAG